MATTNTQIAPLIQNDALVDATLKRKSETTAERMPAKLNHIDLDSEQYDDDDSPKKPGRKPINAELPNNATNSDKRRAQNRAAQRAFRERKDRYVKELEDRIQALESMTANNDKSEATERLRSENNQLRELVKKLTTENRTLKEIQFTFQPPVISESTTTAAATTAAASMTSPVTLRNKEQPTFNASVDASLHAQQVGHPSPVSPLEQLSHLQTPPETNNEDSISNNNNNSNSNSNSNSNNSNSNSNVYNKSDVSDIDTIALHQMLQAAAAAMTAAKDATSLSLPSNSALTTTTTPVTATTSTTDVSVAALQLLASQSQASSQTANALLAGTYGTPDVTSTILPNDQFMQNVSSPATALAMQELLASQLFPPLAPASTSSASPQTPSLSQPSQFTSPYTTFNSPPDAFGADALAFNTDTLAFLSQNLNNPIFTDYRDTSSLNALLSEPVEVPVPGANGQPLVFDDTVNSLPSATIVPLENLTGMESMVNPMEAKQQPLAASVANHQKLEEYCASGVLSEDDLDFLCAEMKTKCRAAKEAAEAKFEQLRKEYADQEKRVAHAKLMSSQLDALGTDNTSINGSNTTPPLP